MNWNWNFIACAIAAVCTIVTGGFVGLLTLGSVVTAQLVADQAFEKPEVERIPNFTFLELAIGDLINDDSFTEWSKKHDESQNSLPGAHYNLYEDRVRMHQNKIEINRELIEFYVVEFDGVVSSINIKLANCPILKKAIEHKIDNEIGLADCQLTCEDGSIVIANDSKFNIASPKFYQYLAERSAITDEKLLKY